MGGDGGDGKDGVWCVSVVGGRGEDGNDGVWCVSVVGGRGEDGNGIGLEMMKMVVGESEDILRNNILRIKVNKWEELTWEFMR
nr:hypothetical protein [Tanacetum cinerariifolium]